MNDVLWIRRTSGGKTGVSSIPVATSTVQAKIGRIPNEAVLYPCTTDTLQDSRVMWATLTPRGTTRHYLEDHHYETINNSRFQKLTIAASPSEHVRKFSFFQNVPGIFISIFHPLIMSSSYYYHFIQVYSD